MFKFFIRELPKLKKLLTIQYFLTAAIDRTTGLIEQPSSQGKFSEKIAQHIPPLRKKFAYRNPVILTTSWVYLAKYSSPVVVMKLTV